MFTIIWTSIFSFSVIISFLVQPLRETLSLSLFLVFPSSISVSSSPSSLLHYPHFTFLHSTTLEEVFKTKKLKFLLLLYFQRHRKISKPRLQVESPLSLSFTLIDDNNNNMDSSPHQNWLGFSLSNHSNLPSHSSPLSLFHSFTSSSSGTHHTLFLYMHILAQT